MRESFAEDAESDDTINASHTNNYPTMIFCSPNAGFAEYF